MKNRLNITIDNVLMEEAKLYAAKHNTSLSQLVEGFFEKLIKADTLEKEHILDLLDQLPKAKKPGSRKYSKESYYEENKKKYGF